MAIGKELNKAFNRLCKSIYKAANESGMSEGKLIEVLSKRKEKILGEVLMEVHKKGLIEQIKGKKYDVTGKGGGAILNPYK